MRYLIILLLISQTAFSAEKLLHCKFKWGDKVSPEKKTVFSEGELSDVYLKIDFDREKVIDSPFNVYGTFGINKTNVVFTSSEVKWYGKNKYVRRVATLDRQTGRLRSVYNNLANKRESGEENYTCSLGNLRF